MPTNYYDAIIVGQDLPVVMTGCLLARRGFRVLWLGDGEAQDGVTWQDLELPSAAVFFCGFERPAPQRVLHEISLTQLLKRRLLPLRPAFQVALPKARLDIGDNDILMRELDREFPEDRTSHQKVLASMTDVDAHLDALLELENTFPPQGFWERRELARVGVDPREEPDPMKGLGISQIVQAVAKVAAPLAPQNLVSSALVRLFTTWRRGTARVPGGRRGLREAFLGKIETQSGELQPHGRADHVTMRRGRVTGLVLQGKTEAIGCGAVIVGSAARARALAQEAQPIPKPLRWTDQNVSVVGYRYVLNLVVPSEAIPEGMGAVVVGVDPSQDVFLLYTSEAAGSGRVVITVETTVPTPLVTDEMRLRLVVAVSRIVPFVQENLLLGHSPHDGLLALGKLAAQGPQPNVWPMTPVFQCAAPSWGLAALPYKTGWKGLYMVSQSTLPALGFEGEFAAAWGVARLLTLSQGKKDFLKGHSLWGG